VSTVSLRLPNYLHDKVRELAQQENVSINQFIVLAVAEKISALVTEDYLAERASRGSRAKFERAMAQVADMEPLAHDASSRQDTSTKRRRHRARDAWSSLRKRTQQGFRGYPLATVAYYGPDNRFASKVAVGIILEEDGDVAFLERWFSQDQDVRTDPTINQEIAEFVDRHQVKSVGIADRIIGCPHEEGKDYPLGESCPQCPYWANRDRWTGELIEEDQEPSTVTTATGVGWYRAEQWERLREISADRERLEETYKDWVASAEEALREMRKVGLYAEKVDVDVEELLAWCRAQGRDVDSAARAQYAAVMLRQRYEGHSRESGG
jgi:hypothetical protein